MSENKLNTDNENENDYTTNASMTPSPKKG